jgi:hypothetical protein
MRYEARRGTKGWMVWDSQRKAVAIVDGYFAISLSEETAVRFAANLNKGVSPATHGKT